MNRPLKSISPVSGSVASRVTKGRFFVHFFQGKFRGKFFPKKCWEKLQFSAEKVLKNHFFNKFDEIFRGKSLSVGKNVRKIGPRFVKKWPKM
jgi:hypothetical protein